MIRGGGGDFGPLVSCIQTRRGVQMSASSPPAIRADLRPAVSASARFGKFPDARLNFSQLLGVCARASGALRAGAAVGFRCHGSRLQRARLLPSVIARGSAQMLRSGSEPLRKGRGPGHRSFCARIGSDNVHVCPRLCTFTCVRCTFRGQTGDLPVATATNEPNKAKGSTLGSYLLVTVTTGPGLESIWVEFR